MTSRDRLLDLSPFAHLIATSLFTVGLLGCGGADPEPKTPKEIVDVPPALVIPIDNDQQEVRRPPEIAGQLPSDFPADLPLYLPASLVDFGDDGGRPWVELLAPAARGRVEAELWQKIRDAGWQQDGSTWRQGGREVRIDTRDGQPGTVIRVVY